MEKEVKKEKANQLESFRKLIIEYLEQCADVKFTMEKKRQIAEMMVEDLIKKVQETPVNVDSNPKYSNFSHTDHNDYSDYSNYSNYIDF